MNARRGEKFLPDHPEILKSITSWAKEKSILSSPAIAIFKTWEGASLAIGRVKTWLNAEGGMRFIIVLGGKIVWTRALRVGHIVLEG